MPRRQPVDLSAHVNRTVGNDQEARFPVSLQPIYYERNGSQQPFPNRVAVVRDDTSEALAVVSDRYTLVPHAEILDSVEGALQGLDVGPVPRGIFLDRGGARLRALFKFPALATHVLGNDRICPCVRIQNTYDGTSKIGVQIGAFRFVCTNLAVGGGGVFASGFMAVHAGDIPVGEVAEQLATYLTRFESIVGLYRAWKSRALEPEPAEELVKALPKRPATVVSNRIAGMSRPTVYYAYNSATDYATHRMRSAAAAFRLLEHINSTFQHQFPVSRN